MCVYVGLRVLVYYVCNSVSPELQTPHVYLEEPLHSEVHGNLPEQCFVGLYQMKSYSSY